MKVAIVTTDSREHFERYEVSVPYFGTAPQALLEGLALFRGVEVHVVSCVRQPMATPVRLAPNILCHTCHVPALGWMRTAFQGCIRAHRKKLREIEPDIVHGQGTERDCAISSVLSGFPNIVTVHGNMRLIARELKARPFSYLWLAARLERFTLPRSLGVVCISRYTEEAVSVVAKRTWVVPNAVDASFFEIQAKPPQQTPPLILCVGLVCPRKNQNAFIRSLGPVAQPWPFEVLFLGDISGEPGYTADFHALVKARPWCRHAGFADRQTLKAHLARASILALPSREDNCPMVVLEAMAAGVPVLAANVGGLPELIEEGKTGLFCDPLDAGSMSAAVQKILANPAAAREMAGRAKQTARDRFHPGIVAKRHIQIYGEIVGSRLGKQWQDR